MYNYDTLEYNRKNLYPNSILYRLSNHSKGYEDLYKVIRINKKSITVKKMFYSTQHIRIPEKDYGFYVRLSNVNIAVYFKDIFDNELRNMKIFGRDISEIKTSKFNQVDPFALFHAFKVQNENMRLMQRVVKEIQLK